MPEGEVALRVRYGFGFHFVEKIATFIYQRESERVVAGSGKSGYQVNVHCRCFFFWSKRKKSCIAFKRSSHTCSLVFLAKRDFFKWAAASADAH